MITCRNQNLSEEIVEEAEGERKGGWIIFSAQLHIFKCRSQLVIDDEDSAKRLDVDVVAILSKLHKLSIFRNQTSLLFSGTKRQGGCKIFAEDQACDTFDILIAAHNNSSETIIRGRGHFSIVVKK